MFPRIPCGFSPLALLASAVLGLASPAGAAELPEKVVADSALSALLDAGGAAPVVVTVRSGSSATRAARLMKKGSRAAEKSAIRAAVDPVIARHFGRKSGGAKIMRLTTSPRFATELTADEIAALAKDPAVVSIAYDIPVKRQLTTSIPLIQMDEVRADGGRGAGATVAIIDDGAQRGHPFLGGRHIAAAEGCIRGGGGDCPNGQDTMFGAGAGAAAAGASHGTHVAGIAIGRSPSASEPRYGVAIEARYIPINVFRGADTTEFSNLDRALEYVEDLVLTDDNQYDIASVNMSIGGGAFADDCDADLPDTKAIVDRLRALGVPVVISAGNDGHADKVSAPGCVSSAVTVGATSHAGVLSSYSDLSETVDLLGPGGDFPSEGDSCILSSVPTSAYDRFCGTSMAAPHVAGTFAVLRSLFPDEPLHRLQAALASTGRLVADQRSGGFHTKPLIRVADAVELLGERTPPANDDFADAIPLAVWQRVLATNLFATEEPGEPFAASAAINGSIWFSFTPTTTRRYYVDLRDSSFNTFVKVFTGAGLGSLQAVRANDDRTSTEKTSRVTFNGIAGTTYRIAVGGIRSAQGAAIVRIGAAQEAPANDDFADASAITVGSDIVTVTGNNALATFETGEQRPFGSGNRSVWWSFRAARSGIHVIDTNGSSFDTVLGVYRGTTVDGATLVDADDDSGDDLASRVELNATAGRTYKIQVNSFAATTGSIVLTISPPGTLSAAAEVAAAVAK